MKKLIVVLISLMMILGNIQAAFGETSYKPPKYAKWDDGRVLVGSDGKTYQFPNSLNMKVRVLNVTQGKWEVAPWLETTQPHRVYTMKEPNGDRHWAYCIEHGVWVQNLSTYMNNQDTEDIENAFNKALGDKQYTYFMLSLYFGYQNEYGVGVTDDLERLGFFDSESFKKSGRSKSSYIRDDWYWATQALIWEITQGHRDNDMNRRSNSLGVDGYHYYQTVKDRSAGDIYSWMTDAMRKFEKFPAAIGSNKRKDDPKLVSLNPDRMVEKSGKKYYTYTFRDTTGLNVDFEVFNPFSLKKKTLPKTKAHLEFDSVKDRYVLYVSEEVVDSGEVVEIRHRMKGTNPANDKGLAFYSWHTANKSMKNQSMAIGYIDPTPRYLQFIKGTKLEGERPEPEYFPTFEFKVEKKDKNPGFDGNDKTPMGEAELNATYILLRDGIEVDRVTLDTYGNTETLRDMPWDEASDFDFSETGTKEHYLPGANPGDPPVLHCTVKPAKLNWDKTATYEIREIRPDGRFIEPDTGVRKYNISYHAESNTLRNCMSEPESWDEIVYTVNRTVIEGDTAAINEGNSTGTLDTLSDPLTFGTQVFINDNYRGKLTLSKSLQSENVFEPNANSGVQKESTKSLWRLKLDMGGFENHPYIRYVKEPDLLDGTAVYRVVRDNGGESSEDKPMKIGSNGDLVILDIPYGAYTMEEVKADDVSYTLEHFKVKIGEHNKAYSVTEVNDDRYDYNIRNKKKTNIIKLLKTNAETGKTAFSEGTKVYIRYKGNQLLADPTKSKHYTRFLPNASDISKEGNYSFTLNGNGEIVIPYEIPFGTYEVLEWGLPEGYFVGEYGASGKAKSHNYSEITEGQLKALLGHSYTDIVTLYDAEGKRVKYKDKSEYTVDEICNIYTFKVENQNHHKDGNPSQKVTSDGIVTPTDPNYDKDNYSYEGYYKAVALPNNTVKGKIVISKIGEIFETVVKTIKDGLTIFTPKFESKGKLQGSKFEIYAAEDNLLNDGHLGAKIYDKDGNEIIIPTLKSTHRGNSLENVEGLLGKKYLEKVYDTGKLSLPTGEDMFFLKERLDSELNKYIRVFTTGKSKGSTYSYTFNREEGDLTYSYDVKVEGNLSIGGINETAVKIIKTVMPKEGTLSNIGGSNYEVDTDGNRVKNAYGLTKAKLYYGKPLAEIPLGSFVDPKNTDPTKRITGDFLAYSSKTYLYEADGKEGLNMNGDKEDFSKLSQKRYIEKDYEAYMLKTEDLELVKEKVIDRPEVTISGTTYPEVSHEEYITEAEVNLPAEIAPDGHTVITPAKKYDDTKERLTKFEVEKAGGRKLLDKTVGKDAVVKDTSGNAAKYTIGYYEGTNYTESKSFIPLDANGDYVNPEIKDILDAKIAEGFSVVPFPKKDIGYENHYIILKNGATEKYEVLLLNKTFTESDMYGNFENSLVEVLDFNIFLDKGSEKGFKVEFDGFILETSKEGEVYLTKITRQGDAAPLVDLAPNYEREDEGLTTTLKGREPKENWCLRTKENIKTYMSHMGKRVRIFMEIPLSSISRFDKVLPEIVVNHKNPEDGYVFTKTVDWLSKLNPGMEEVSFDEFNGNVLVTAKKVPSLTGETMYTVEVIMTSDRGNEAIITYPDGYTAKCYEEKIPDGNRVGVMEYEGIYNTVRSSKSQHIETVTTDDEGKAESNLLPLGKYYVKEVEAPEMYINSGKAIEVELKYQDKFTPVIFKDISFINKYMNVEIDLEKGFETGFNTNNYVKGDGAKFGIYAAEDYIAADGKKIEKDSLVGVGRPDETGKMLLKLKLPKGKYYVKELETRAGYNLLPHRLYFTTQDKITSTEPKISYPSDGISGEITMMSYGKAEIDLRIENRFPMPGITIDKIEHSLSENSVFEKGKIEANKSESVLNLKLSNNEETEIMLPNGKLIKVKVLGNVIEYTLDGISKAYTQEEAFTNSYAEYSKKFNKVKGEDTSVKTTTFNFKGVGALAPTVNITLNHTPKTKDELLWIDSNHNGIKDPGEETAVKRGIVDTEGNQVYKHTGTIEIEGSLIELKDKLSESLDSTGGIFSYILHKSGEVEVSHAASFAGKVEDAYKGSVSGIGINPADIKYMENVTGVRTNTKSDSVQIKINKGTGTDVEILKNRAKESVIFVPPTYPKEEPGKLNIGTKASDIKTGTNISNAEKDTTFIDHVSYTNLTVGKEYTVRGVLMDKDTGKELLVNGKPVTAEKTFTAEKRDGIVEVIFALDSRSLEGKTTVVFERLYQDNIEVASHTDITDEEQTVYIPKIRTTATDEKSGTHIAKVSNKITIVDAVKYTNLVIGKTYKVVGTLMDKATGKELLVNGKNVTAVKTFTADSMSGYINLTFTFDGKGLGGKSVVVFEKLYHEDILVATHTDITDMGQTVKIKNKYGRIVLDGLDNPDIFEDGKVTYVPKTGDTSNLKLYIFMMVSSMLSLLFIGLVSIKRKLTVKK